MELKSNSEYFKAFEKSCKIIVEQEGACEGKKSVACRDCPMWQAFNLKYLCGYNITMGYFYKNINLESAKKFLEDYKKLKDNKNEQI